MEFHVYSRQSIEALPPMSVGHLIISIRTPGDPRRVRLPVGECTRGVLHMQFHDLDRVPVDPIPILGGGPQPDHLVVNETTLFNDDHARELLAFVRAKRDELNGNAGLGAILVHCDAGWSRSPAVAAALGKVLFDQDDSWWFKAKTPNRRVYRTIIAVHQAELDADDALRLATGNVI